MQLSSIPIQNPAVLAREIVDGEMVLVNADSAASLALTTQTAVSVWKMTDGNNSIQNIIDGILDQFQDVPDTVSSDVLAFIKLLSRDGFIGFEWNEHESR